MPHYIYSSTYRNAPGRHLWGHTCCGTSVVPPQPCIPLCIQGRPQQHFEVGRASHPRIVPFPKTVEGHLTPERFHLPVHVAELCHATELTWRGFIRGKGIGKGGRGWGDQPLVIGATEEKTEAGGRGREAERDRNRERGYSLSFCPTWSYPSVPN